MLFYFFTTSVSHVVQDYFPRLQGRGILDAILDFFMHPFALCLCLFVYKCFFSARPLFIGATL